MLVLSLYGARRETRHDSSLQDKHENDQRHRDHHGARRDFPPRDYEAGAAGEISQADRDRPYGVVGSELHSEEKHIPGIDKCQDRPRKNTGRG